MKTWITYLAALLMAAATALLLGDTIWIGPALDTLGEIAVNIGVFLAVCLALISFTAGVASVRKDKIGGKVLGTSVAWSVVLALLLPMAAALASALLPVAFPVSSTAGGGTNTQMAGMALRSGAGLLFSGNIGVFLGSANSFLLPLLVVGFVMGCALTPSADTIKPAYVSLNSFSEATFRVARALNVFGYILIYVTASRMLVDIYQEKTIFVSAEFAARAVGIPLAITLVLLPLLYAIFTKGKKNPYRVLYRNIASELAAFTTGNFIFAMPFMMSGERHNDGVQKRIAATTTGIHHLISRPGSSAVATFAIIAVLNNVTETATPVGACCLIALACSLCSFAGSVSTGFEVMFITFAAMRILGIEVYGAEATIIGLLPLLSGLGSLLDCQAALLGANVTGRATGTDITPPYKDIL